MEHLKIYSKKLRKVQLTTTLGVWIIATGMLALCIPLVTITKSGIILPLTVILGVSVVTITIWQSSNIQTINSITLSNSMKELEQRVTNLEVICSNEELSFQNKLKQIESKD